MKSIVLRICAIVLFSLVAVIGYSQSVSIGTPVTTSSTCAANGTIKVTVTVTPPTSQTVVSIYYSITSNVNGYTISETENPSTPNTYTFEGAPSGTHTIKVKAVFSNGTDASATRTATVSGSYTEPQATVNEWVPSLSTCDTTGVAYVKVLGGSKPITVRIVEYNGSTSGDPVGRVYGRMTTISGGNDYYFHSLPSGDYKFEIQDNCNFTFYRTFTVRTIDPKTVLAPYMYFTYSWYQRCQPVVYAYLSLSSSILNYSNIQNYYTRHPAFEYQVTTTDGHTSSWKRIYSGDRDTIPANSTGVHSATYQVRNNCTGEIIKTGTSTLSSEISSAYSSIYPYIEDCTKLRFRISTVYTGDSCLIEYNGYSSGWIPVASYIEIPTNFSDLKSLFESGKTTVSYQIKNPCGRTTSGTVSIRVPTVVYDNILYCGYYRGGYVWSDYEGIVCMPAMQIVKNRTTGEADTLYITSRSVYQLSKKTFETGSYDITLVGADGYSTTRTVTLTGLTPSFSTTNDGCTGLGYIRISSGITSGSRIRVVESPPGSSYYFDAMSTGTSHYIYPDNGANGIPGDYKIAITDTCNITKEYNVTIPILQYKAYNFDVIRTTEDCEGQWVKFTGQITRINNSGEANYTTYYRLTGYPTGYEPKDAKYYFTSADSLKLTLPGNYQFRITYSSSSNYCTTQFAPVTINYEGAATRADLSQSLAYICPGNPDNEGHIYVQATKGKAPYTYYISDAGTGGLAVVDGTNPYLGKNGTGDFSQGPNLLKGTVYDVTIQDSCGTIAVQQFKVGDLNEIRLASVERSPVCVGEPIELRAMGLPNPTYEWTGPNSFHTFVQSPVIPSAVLANSGNYDVIITTSLCRDTSVTLTVPVEVQAVPTIVLTSGSGDTTLCYGSIVSPIVYTWGGSATDVTITGLSSYYTATKDLVAKTITISGTAYSACTYTITTNGCTPVSITGSFAISQKPTLNRSGYGTSPLIVCFGNSMPSVSSYYYYWGNYTTDVAVTGDLPPGVTASINQINKRVTFVGTPTAEGTYNYVVTATTSDPTNVCPPTVLTGTIKVTSAKVRLLSGSNIQSVCQRQTITPIVYKWDGAATSLTRSGTLPSGLSSSLNYSDSTLTISGTIAASATAGSYPYTIATSGGSCGGTSLTGTITVNTPPAFPASIVSADTICPGGLAKVRVNPSVVGEKYRIYNALSGGTLIAGPVNGTGGSIELNCETINSTRTYYIEAESALGCLTNRLAIPAVVRTTRFAYPDIRIQVCPSPTRNMNLNQFIDTVDLVSVSWSKSGSASPSLNSDGHSISTGAMTQGAIYLYKYTITNHCATKSANLYLTVLDDEIHTLPPDTVRICYLFAQGVQLNQILGVEAAGTWTYNSTVNPTNAVSSYVHVPTNSNMAGAVIFDGYTAYSGLSSSYNYNGNPAEKIVKFKYTANQNSCLGGSFNRTLIIILTDKMP